MDSRALTEAVVAEVQLLERSITLTWERRGKKQQIRTLIYFPF